MIVKLFRSKKKYIDNRDQYGQGKDTLRTTAYREFFDHLQKTYMEITDLVKGKRRKPRFYQLMSGGLNVFKLLFKLPSYRGVAWSGIKFVKALARPYETTTESTNLNKALNTLMKSIAKLKGITTKTEELHNLPRNYDPETINIYAASHRDGLFDQVGLAHLNVDSMVFFGAVNNFVPNWLNKIFKLKDRLIGWVNNNPGFIVVGKGAGLPPIDKALQIVNTTKARSFLIFPGGRLPEGFGATMGAREKFASEDGLLGAFEKEGFKINIIPISMRHNATLFNESIPLTGSEHLSVRIGDNISDDIRKTMINIGGHASLGSLLRYALIDDLVTNDQLIWGQVRTNKLKSTLSKYLGTDIGLQCKDIL